MGTRYKRAHLSAVRPSFSDEDTWDIGAITALFAYGSRTANLISVRPNDEF